MNNCVLMRGFPAAFALLLALSPAQGKTPRSPVEKGARPALAQGAKAPARSAAPASVYASADGSCMTARKRLWTEAGWIVRRVTSCR